MIKTQIPKISRNDFEIKSISQIKSHNLGKQGESQWSLVFRNKILDTWLGLANLIFWVM